MKDIDIYNLASQVLGDITHALNESRYTELGGELTITWCTKKKFGSYASSLDEAGKPPKHRVTMYYELARQVWRDAEELCEFLRSIPQGSGVDKLYDLYGDRVKLPKGFNDEVLVNNIFVAAIT